MQNEQLRLRQESREKAKNSRESNRMKLKEQDQQLINRVRSVISEYKSSIIKTAEIDVSKIVHAFNRPKRNSYKKNNPSILSSSMSHIGQASSPLINRKRPLERAGSVKKEKIVLVRCSSPP